MLIGDLLLRGTAWLSLVAWGAGEWRRSREPAPARRARMAWTAGALALLVHSGLAFHLRHGWSHSAAWLDTARQTEAVTGVAMGGGLLVNYLFLAGWAAEVAWWWAAPASFLARPAALDRAARAFFLLMFLNGAVVFAHGPVRALGLAVVCAVVAAWYRARGAGSRHG